MMMMMMMTLSEDILPNSFHTLYFIFHFMLYPQTFFRGAGDESDQGSLFRK